MIETDTDKQILNYQMSDTQRNVVMKLPTRLSKEPVVESIFEIRFKQGFSIAEILPGILHENFNPKPKIKNLPANDIPSEIRMSNPTLMYLPLIEAEIENFRISVGSMNVIISCKLPYPKWPAFKDMIQKNMKYLKKIDNIGEVERYSTKFVNIIEAKTYSEQIKKLNMSVKIGQNKNYSNINIELHQIENEIVHILSIRTNTSVKFNNGYELNGIMFNVDSIKNCDSCDFDTFILDLDSKLECIKQSNKRIFFGCLTQDTIDRMEPNYD